MINPDFLYLAQPHKKECLYNTKGDPVVLTKDVRFQHCPVLAGLRFFEDDSIFVSTDSTGHVEAQIVEDKAFEILSDPLKILVFRPTDFIEVSDVSPENPFMPSAPVIEVINTIDTKSFLCYLLQMAMNHPSKISVYNQYRRQIEF